MKLSDMFLFGSSFAAVGREGGHYEKSLKWLERHYLDEVRWTQSGWDTVHRPPTHYNLQLSRQGSLCQNFEWKMFPIHLFGLELSADEMKTLKSTEKSTEVCPSLYCWCHISTMLLILYNIEQGCPVIILSCLLGVYSLYAPPVNLSPVLHPFFLFNCSCN